MVTGACKPAGQRGSERMGRNIMAAGEHLAKVDPPSEATSETIKLDWVTPDVAEYDITWLTQSGLSGTGADLGIYS
jgi:hypothetical protein